MQHACAQDGTIELRRSLNAGRLPSGFVALADQQIGGPVPDLLTLNRGPKGRGGEPAGGVAIADAPSRARFVLESEGDAYARRANRIVIRHRHGQVVAVIEIISPGNKSSNAAVRALVRKTSELIWQGIHLLVVDLFPPLERDPQRISKAIWDEVEDAPFELPADKPLTAAAYRASPTRTAFIEPIAVGDVLPALPIFLTDFDYVPTPLEDTYMASWAAYPSDFKAMLESAHCTQPTRAEDKESK